MTGWLTQLSSILAGTRRPGAGRIARLLLGGLLLLGASQSALAGTDFCSDYPTDINGYHVIDGNDPALTPLTLPSSIGIDANCYFKNFPQSAKWPDGLTSTLNFKFDGYLAIFDGVYYSGNMACSNTTTHIWFVNGGAYAPNNSCQDLFIPAETIGKATPGPTATVGVPFTYTMTIPVLYDLSTDTYYNQPSANNLSMATVYDDLTQTGASLTYVSNTAYLIDGSGVKTSIGPLTLGATQATLDSMGITTSDNTKHLVFSADYNPVLTNIQAGTQVVIELTVVLDDVASNSIGTQFTNTAQWWFGRVIDNVAYAPLPGQSGVSQPMTIAGPNLTMTKSAASTSINLGYPLTYTLDVQNTGGSDAWNATILDKIPAGMCGTDPSSTVTAQIFQADGVTPVGSALTAGTDYSVSWDASGTPCLLTLNMLSAASKLAPTQRLIITYQAQLDSSQTTTGTSYTNYAGATQWYNADSSYSSRHLYTGNVDTGTPGVTDNQDAFTVTSAIAGYYFLKTAQDLTTGAQETATNGLTAYAGDTIRYTLQIQNYTKPPLNNITIVDDLGRFNPGAYQAYLVLGPNDLPSTATVTTCNACGTGGAPKITITGLTLPSNGQYYLTYDVRLATSLSSTDVVNNQATMSGTEDPPVSTLHAGDSDDPLINGTVDLDNNAGGTVDPTSIAIQVPTALNKTNPATTTATIGQTFSYQVTIPATPVNIPLYDVKIVDNLGLSAADMTFVSASVDSSSPIGSGWSLVNTGSATLPIIEDQSTGIDIPPGQQAIINITVKLGDTTTNARTLNFTNTATYIYNKINGGGETTTGSTGYVTTPPMTVVEPQLGNASKVVTDGAGNPITGPVSTGDVLKYTVTVTNNGDATAYDTSVQDYLPANTALIASSATATINGSAVTGFIVDPTTTPEGALTWGYQNGDGSLDIPVGQTLVLTYQVTVLTANGTPITNSAYIDWSSLDAGVLGERTGDGCGTSTGTTAPDTYCIGPLSATVNAADPTALAKTVDSDTWSTAPGTATGTLRAGDTVVYNLDLTLREGVTGNVVVTDTLPANMVFDGTISIAPVTGNTFSFVPPSGPSVGASGTLTWNIGTVNNTADNDPTNNILRIQYRARVQNTITQANTTTLTNNATLDYSINSVAGTQKTASANISVWQPQLNISKVADKTVVGDNEVVTYTVTLANTGTAPAYDPVLQDTLPVGMRNTTPTITSVVLTDGVTPTTLPAPYPAASYDTGTGVAVWNFDTGVANAYAIPPNYSLVVQYQATTDATLGAGVSMTNHAQINHYYSFDSADIPAGSVLSDRKDYTSTSYASATVSTTAPGALSKTALVTQAAIGQPFTFQIKVPATPLSTSLYDVHVKDDISLATRGVSVSFLSANASLSSGTTWASLSNVGTATNLDLVDNSSGGLDIPAGQQLTVNVTMVFTDDQTNNTPGKVFSNSAYYTYNSIDNDTAGTTTTTTADTAATNTVTIVAPNLIMTKTGPATLYLDTSGSFTLDVQNAGGATAWNTVITDVLPNVTTAPIAGMCASAPTITSVGIYDAGNVLQTTLTAGTDYSVNFAAAPSCTLTLNMLTAAAAIPAGYHLKVIYSASIDPGSVSGVSLTNIAGATQYQSADPGVAGVTVHTYNNTLGDAAAATASNTDFQDAWTLTTAAPALVFTKDVYDVTTNSPGTTANPGDVLRYTISIANASTVDANNISFVDDLDNLNTPARFVPNTLAVNTSTLAAGFTDTSNASGGSKGTGIVQLSGLNVPAGSTISFSFTVQLVPVIANATVVLNQASISGNAIDSQVSDDPNTTATPDDATRTTISSAPQFQIYKTSTDLTGSATELLPGDELLYTITVKNIGTADAVNATLRDQIPANTTYVADSTTLNGNPVTDPANGVSALQNGMLIYSSADTTAGHMPADSTTSTANVATITFKVRINAGVVSGTVISNQGFLNAAAATTPTMTFDTPSDDPGTAVLNDPTLDVIGNVPLIDAVKTVTLLNDLNGNGYVDAGDTLQYTITVTNYGAVQATGVTLTDAVPANTTYVTNTTTLNTLAVPDAGGGTSPLVGGLPISSSDLTPPLPTVGYLSPGGTATVIFNVTVNTGVGTGVTISNQGYVASNEQATEPTDADGNDSNGDQPTVIVTGNAQLLTINKQVAVVGGGAALAGGKLEYTVTVTNAGTVPATGITLHDDLDEVTPGYITYDGTVPATLNGSMTGVTITGNVIDADYSTTYGNLAPGQTITLRFRADINATLPIGTVVTNRAHTTWNTSQTAYADVSISIGGTPGSAALNGKVWHDANFNKTFDSGETQLANWTVDLLYKGKLLASTVSDSNGDYHFTGLAPNDMVADRYELRFSAPGAGANTAKLGKADSSLSNSTYTFVDGLQYISEIIVKSGDSLTNLNMPITPNGVIYNSIARTPVAGATVTMLNAASGQPLDTACFDDPAQQNQVTLAYGYYKFDVNFLGGNCPAGGDYVIHVTPPTGYSNNESVVIPPQTNAATGPYDVPTCPADAVATPAGYCEAQAFSGAPALAIAAGSAQTYYYLKLTLSDPPPGANQIYNNPIPVDPDLADVLNVSKVSDKVNVTRGELVPYTITVRNSLLVSLNNVSIVDDYPAGFKYVAGSARFNGVATEPVINGNEMSWTTNISPGTTYTIKLLLIVGAGVHEGEYVNRAHVYSPLTNSSSAEATATVRVVPDATFDCSDIVGKVYDDRNLNGYQDKGEPGIGGVRLATARGLLITTDSHGRFHLTCAAVPNEDRGSNFILKLDERSLPSGYRVTTENPRVERLTRGKAVNFSFGATLHHVVTMDVADGVFEHDSDQLRDQWRSRIGLLITQLRKGPSILRITYLADVENKSLVKDRIAALKDRISKRWKEVGSYQLTIETEIFWRHGGPVTQGEPLP